jgi:hypothetical protein
VPHGAREKTGVSPQQFLIQWQWGNALGKSNGFSLKANGLSHIEFNERYAWD